jgi:hypothetical protein
VKSIKVTGFAVLTALALATASGVAAASPAAFTAEKYPASITAEATLSGPGVIGTSAFGSMSCTMPRLTGSLTHQAAPLTALATFSENCNFAANKCEFTFHPVAESSSGTFDIGGCTSFTGVNSSGCKITLLSKKGLAATFENGGTGSKAFIEIKANATGLKYSSSNCNPIGTVFSDGTYTGTWRVSATNGGEATGLSVTPFPGLSVSATHEFQTENYPALISGEQASATIGGELVKKITLTTAAGILKCEAATFSTPAGQEGLLHASSELSLTPASGGCTLQGLTSATVTPEAGCADSFSITSEKNTGSMFLCKTEITTAGSKCKIIVSGQSRSGMEFVNIGSGTSAMVEAKANLSGLEYQVIEGATCPLMTTSGVHIDGGYKGAAKLRVGPLS